MSEPQSRTEYRVVVDFDGGHPQGIYGPFDLELARRVALEEQGQCPVRIQKSEVTETRTPWEDVQDGE